MKTTFNHSLKALFAMFAIGLFTMSFVACGDDDKEYTPPSTTTKTNQFKFGNEKWNIKSAACYYNSERDGYNFVFSDSTQNLTKLDAETEYNKPYGNYLVMDAPGKLVNSVTNLADGSLSSGTWSFFVECNDGFASSFVSGTLSINITGALYTIKMMANDYDGKSWYITYEGQLSRALQYMYSGKAV